MSGCVSKAKRTGDSGFKCYGELAKDWIGIECLTTLDCPEKHRCCATGEVNHCALECEDHEACVPGGPETCHAGSKCRPSDTRSGGDCVVASPGVKCGAVRCSGAKPACRYDSKKRRAECIALTEDGYFPESAFAEVAALLRCAAPSDCAGERCCTGGPLPMTECTGMCKSGIDVCETVRDCPDFVGPATGCAADPSGPPFLKTCEYAFKQ